MATIGTNECPICKGFLATALQRAQRGMYRVNCSNCGLHLLPTEAEEDLAGTLRDDATRARVAHAIHKLPALAPLTNDRLHNLVATSGLPPALERLDNLVQHLALDREPGEGVALVAMNLRAMLGCASTSGADWAIQQAQALGLIAPVGVGLHALTANGWQRHAALMRDGAGSRHAFMAMSFGDDALRQFFTPHLQPAVAFTGFELRTTEHEQKTPGLIDNRMRVELRTSRFVICDLTHGNRGAYWEAGFAEGIGRPG